MNQEGEETAQDGVLDKQKGAANCAEDSTSDGNLFEFEKAARNNELDRPEPVDENRNHFYMEIRKILFGSAAEEVDDENNEISFGSGENVAQALENEVDESRANNSQPPRERWIVRDSE